MFDQQTFSAFIDARDRGQRCEISEALYNYFLEVLPPVLTNAWVQLVDGTRVRADFGFAEGADRITAFWRARTPLGPRYYAQHTTTIAKGG